jgi:glycosyltransferase involved in cell wall biosynthesis
VLWQLFRHEKPDLLFINNGGYPAAQSCRLAVIAGRMAGIKKILFVVNNLAYPPRGIFDRMLDKRINRYVSFFITASKAARDRLVEARSFDLEKCINIPNTLMKTVEKNDSIASGIVREEFNIGRDTIVLGSVGLLTKRKGYHVLVEAMAQLRKVSPAGKYKLVIFGEGEERRSLEQMITDHHLEDTVLLPGFRANVMEYVKGVDIFVAPSIANEDFPYVIIEAMMLAKPVIGTRVAGIPEQIADGATGYVVEPGSPEQLVAAIEKMTYENIHTMGLASRQRYFDNFCNKLVMQRYLDLLHNQLKN